MKSICCLPEWSKITLEMAKDFMGDMCGEWCFNHEIIFNDGPPHLIYFINEGVIKISLTRDCICKENNEYEILTQLSHEMAHVISPARKITNNEFCNLYINEGVSEYFSLLVVNKLFGVHEEEFIKFKKDNNYKYYVAMISVRGLLTYDEEFIKKLRIKKPKFYDLVPDDFFDINKEVDPELVKALLSNF
jgi:hypothetical protein